MSSSLGMIAYILTNAESARATDVRVKHARQHLQAVHAAPLSETRVGDRRSGIISWDTQPNVQWNSMSTRAGAGTCWLHIPSVAGGPDSEIDPWDLATETLNGSMELADLGSPYAVTRWEGGTIRIANDVLGLARLFQYRFDGGVVWTTRQGLAHIFAGVAPERNPTAWAGMATMGWAPGGETQLGYGTQVPGGSRIQATYNSERVDIETHGEFPGWLSRVRDESAPTTHQNVNDAELLMMTAKRWPGASVADLSGGKDSRVVAALGIRSQSISGVRTLNTDPGEVETARRLIALADNPVPHHIVEVNSKSAPQDPFEVRLASKHRAFEGRYLAHSALSSTFNGFHSASQPRFSGLGGEVIEGGNFATGSWKEKLIGGRIGVAHDRLAKLAGSIGTSANASEMSMATAERFVDAATDMGASTAGEVMDLFYCRDRMPFWSVTFATPNFLCPLFAPSLLRLAMHSLGAPLEKSALHTNLIREALPAWTHVPFYKPEFATRTVAPLWERAEWGQIKQYVERNIDASDAYDPQGLRDILSAVEAGQAGKSHEVAIVRFLWDRTFTPYVDEISFASRRVREELHSVQDCID